MQLPYVYIAGPYSQDDQAENVRVAVEAANEVVRLNAIPFIPHLTHFWHLMTPKSYTFWLWYDLRWLPKCDMLLRLPGASNGADEEEKAAKRLGLPVFHGLDELRAALG